MTEKNKVKNTLTPEYPFKADFLSSFFVYRDQIKPNEVLLKDLDKLAAAYEKKEIDQESLLILKRRNQLLFSFAVSKAENSALTLSEAEEAYQAVVNGFFGDSLSTLKKKLVAGGNLTKKDHDLLEYANIAKVVSGLELRKISLKDIDLDFIIDLHRELTEGLDIFTGKLPDFEPYHSGRLREDNETKVGEYIPAPFTEIRQSIRELLSWLQTNQSIENVFIFHAALYALHPFKNGNKRVCRILEEIIVKTLGYNASGLYSGSYYYHKHQPRYYKQLLDTLSSHNLSRFAAFASEALFFSILGVINSALQKKKQGYLEVSGLPKNVIKSLKPLIKKPELKFSRLLALNKRKISKQTLINYLNEASEFTRRREQGKYVYYSIKGDYSEEIIINNSLADARREGVFIPDEYVW